MDPIPALPIEPNTATDEEGDAAVLGTARLAFWVGLTYLLVNAAVIPVFVMVWRDRSNPMKAMMAFYLVMLCIRICGGGMMSFAGIRALRHRDAFLLRLMAFGGVIVLVTFGSDALIVIYNYFGPPQRTFFRGRLPSVTMSLLRPALTALPALAVMLLAWAAPTRALFVRGERTFTSNP
jgi:hypothetical protein